MDTHWHAMREPCVFPPSFLPGLVLDLDVPYHTCNSGSQLKSLLGFWVWLWLCVYTIHHRDMVAGKLPKRGAATQPLDVTAAIDMHSCSTLKLLKQPRAH